MRQYLFRSVISLAVLVLAACSQSDNGTPSGRLSVSVTDAPVDEAARVVVQFTAVSVQGAGGWQEFELENGPRQIDLLTLQGTDSETLLDGVELTAGRYQAVRLAVDAQPATLDSFIEMPDGLQYSLFIPSGEESGLKLNRGFDVLAGGSHDFVIDFDLRKSVTNPEGLEDYILRPVLRIVDNTVSGGVEGSVAAALFEEVDCGEDGGEAVYVYEGTDATPDDAGSANEPLTTVRVTLDEMTGNLSYEIGFLENAEYTLALTCQGDQDDPEQDDDIVFIASQNVTIAEGQTVTADFQ